MSSKIKQTTNLIRSDPQCIYLYIDTGISRSLTLCMILHSYKDFSGNPLKFFHNIKQA